MDRKIIKLSISFLFLSAVFFLTSEAWAKAVIIIKGSTLTENNLDGPLTIPYLKIELAAWRYPYSDNDILIYDPSLGVLSLYGDSIISTLPTPEDAITLTDGTTGNLVKILEVKQFIIIETDLGIVIDYGGNGSYTGNDGDGGSDTIPPDTSITSGHSGIIGENDVVFTYTGTDNKTSSSGLIYSSMLDGYDAEWTDFTSASSKSYIDLPNGSYIFQVRAMDEAGEVDPTPASLSFTVNFIDTDGDGISDQVENSSCTETSNADTDYDGLMDGDEDLNHNGILDIGETDPCEADTDGDGIPDGWEVQYGLDPLVHDAFHDLDGDGYSNIQEYLHKTDPTNSGDHQFPWELFYPAFIKKIK